MPAARRNMIKMYFGSPGAGKTTLAVRYIIQSRIKKEYDYYFTNFECDVATCVSLDNLGKWTFPEHSLLVIDEAGIQYNSRKYKDLSHSLIEWLKLHRHYLCDVVVISQSWEDVDVTIRRLTTDLYHLVKLGPFTIVRKIFKRVGIDEKTHQIIDQYRFASLLGCLFNRDNFSVFLRNGYYKYFDSFSTPTTPKISAVNSPRLKISPVMWIRQIPLVVSTYIERWHLKPFIWLIACFIAFALFL